MLFVLFCLLNGFDLLCKVLCDSFWEKSYRNKLYLVIAASIDINVFLVFYQKNLNDFFEEQSSCWFFKSEVNFFVQGRFRIVDYSLSSATAINQE